MFYTIAHSKCPPLGGHLECALATVTLQLINHLLYPRNRLWRFQGYIIGDLKVQRCIRSYSTSKGLDMLVIRLPDSIAFHT